MFRPHTWVTPGVTSLFPEGPIPRPPRGRGIGLLTADRPAESLVEVLDMVLGAEDHTIDGNRIVIKERASIVDELVDEILPELDRPLAG